MDKKVFYEKIQDEKSCYNIFLGMKTTTNILGLIRGTCFGYLLHKLNVSPFFLSLFFIISIFANVICYFLFPFLDKKLKQPVKILIYLETITTISLILSILYLIYLKHTNTFGNFWLLNSLNLLLCIPVYGFISASPLFVKTNFSHVDYHKIIRLDFITFSFAKLVGFSLGVFIIDLNYIIFFFILSLIFSLLVRYMYTQIMKIYEKNDVNLNNKTEEISNSDHYYNKFLTYLIVIIPTIFIVIINVQSVYLDKIYGMPFYLFPLINALGGLSFNLFMNKQLKLYTDRRFFLFGAILSLSFITLALFRNLFMVVIALFLIGGIYTTLSTMCTARLYSYSKTRTPKSISTYYTLLSFFNILGTFIIGILFEMYDITLVFSVWGIVIFIIFVIIFILRKMDSKE